MYELGRVFTSKYVATGPSSYKKRICRAAVSQRLRNTAIEGVHLRRLIGAQTLRMVESSVFLLSTRSVSVLPVVTTFILQGPWLVLMKIGSLYVPYSLDKLKV